eukprot:508078-Pleurochrysis_carterae.AAC.1
MKQQFSRGSASWSVRTLHVSKKFAGVFFSLTTRRASLLFHVSLLTTERRAVLLRCRRQMK